MADKIYTADETITLLRAKASDPTACPQGDNFRVKVFRRRTGTLTGIPEHIVTMGDAQVLHIANPEVWLPRIAGGGNFMLSVYPAHDPTSPIGSNVPFNYGNEPMREVQVHALAALVKTQGWQGPLSIVWPVPHELTPQQAQDLYTATSMAPSGNPQVHAPQTNVPNGGIQGGPVPFGNGQGFQLSPGYDPHFAQREREMSEREAKLREEALKRDFELRLKEIEIRYTALVNQATARVDAAPKVPEKSIIAELAPVLGPVLTQMISAQNEMRLAMLKSQETAAAQQQLLLTTLLSKPTVDPAITKLEDKIERMMESSGDDGGAKMVHTMADAMSSMTGMMMSTLKAAAEAGFGGGEKQEHPGLMAVREVARAIESFGSSYSGAMKGRAGPPPAPARQLPPGQRARRAPVGAEAQAGFAGYAGAQAAQPARSGPNFVDQIERMIRAHHDPHEVALLVGQNLSNPDLQNELAAVGGQIPALMERRLGVWLTEKKENHEYIEALFDELTDMLQAAGIIPPDEEDGQEEQAAPVSEPAGQLELVVPNGAGEETEAEE